MSKKTRTIEVDGVFYLWSAWEDLWPKSDLRIWFVESKVPWVIIHFESSLTITPSFVADRIKELQSMNVIFKKKSAQLFTWDSNLQTLQRLDDFESIAIPLLMKECQKIFNEATNQNSDHGVPPQKAFITQMSGVLRPNLCHGETLKAWIYENKQLSEITPDDVPNKEYEVSGMYFNRAIFSFCINEAEQDILFNYFLGPRFARGYHYRLIKRENGSMGLEKHGDRWVS